MKKEEIITGEVTTPKEEVTKVEQRVNSKPNPLTIVLIIFLVLLLIPVLGLLFFRYNTTSPTSKGAVEKCECEKCEKTECPIAQVKEDSGRALLSGWSRFESGDMKITIDIPSYQLSQKLMDQDVISTWDVRVWKTNYAEHLYFNNYDATLFASLYPIQIPEGLGCGQGCVKEHNISVHKYTNKDNLTLEQARDKYVARFNEETQGDGTITGEIKTRWGERTYSFKMDSPGGTSEGNLVIKNGNIYEISFFLSESPKESYDIAVKVLDSIRFNR